METWICSVCGYEHYGEEAPERCPKCGAPKAQFYKKGKGRGCAFGFLLTTVLTAVMTTLFACHSTVTVDNSVVTRLDLNKYLGKWYEVARFDHGFERDMVQCTADYALQDDGTIKVTNRGLKNGKWKTSVGKAKVTEMPGVLRVSFFGPFYSDYRIMMVAPDYSYALIGGASDNYLWILSRTPQIKDSTRDQLLREARRRGYQTSNLIWVDQKPTNSF